MSQDIRENPVLDSSVLDSSVLDSPGAGPTRLRVWIRWLVIPLTLLAWGTVLIALFMLAGHVVETLILIAVALLITYALSPIVRWLHRWLPRWLAIVVTYLAFAAALAALIYIIAGTVASELRALITYVEQQVQPGAKGELASLLRQIGASPGQSNTIGSTIVGAVPNAATHILPIVTGLANASVGIVVILVLSIYFVGSAPRVGRWLRMSTPITQRGRIIYFLETLNRVVGGYIRGQVTLAVLIGLIVGFGMYFLFHLPFAILLGVLAFILEFVPFLGVIISGGACVLVALTQGPVTALLVLGYFVIVHLIEGEIIGPRIVGGAVGLHPAVSLIALIAGAELFGIWGALFAAPLAGLIQAVAVTFWSEYCRAHPELFPEFAGAQTATDGHGPKRPSGGVATSRRPFRPPDVRGIFFRRSA